MMYYVRQNDLPLCFYSESEIEVMKAECDKWDESGRWILKWIPTAEELLVEMLK